MLCSQAITTDDAMEMINKLYNMWPKRLQRGTDADATELLSFIIEAFKAEDLIPFISSKKISCDVCKTERVDFEESGYLGFYIHSKKYGSLSRQILKNFEEKWRCFPEMFGRGNWKGGPWEHFLLNFHLVLWHTCAFSIRLIWEQKYEQIIMIYFKMCSILILSSLINEQSPPYCSDFCHCIQI